MKRAFPGYYRPTAEEFKALWQTATFVVDANVLITAYGYSRRTRETLLDLLSSIKERLWIPHQFALEYHRNRAHAILDQVKQYRAVVEQLEKIEGVFRSRRQHPFVGKSSLARLRELKAELLRGERNYSKLLADDPILDALTELLAGRVGPAPASGDLDRMIKEGDSRFKASTPPGYKDQHKPSPDCFGDYFGWRQMLDYAAAQKCPLIFVTDDEKEDWWYFQGGRKIGPRPELIAEYLGCAGHQFYMYSLEQFMLLSREQLGRAVAPAALLEIRERVASDRRNDEVKAETPTTEIKTAGDSVPLSGDVKSESSPSGESGTKALD